MNRLNDSIGLWKAIIASKMLQNTTMVCFLNKCDILKRKLRSGIQFRSFVKDYGDKPNDVSPVVKCERLVPAFDIMIDHLSFNSHQGEIQKYCGQIHCQPPSNDIYIYDFRHSTLETCQALSAANVVEFLGYESYSHYT